MWSYCKKALHTAHDVTVGIAGVYVLWVLASVVAWVSHLGARVPPVGRVLAAGADPMKKDSASLFQVGLAGGPPGLCFVLLHSLLRPRQLASLGFGAYAQLVYCLHSALSLHWFLVAFVPHDSPVVFRLDEVMPPVLHAGLSLGCLIVAFVVMLSNPRTYQLLGVSQAIGGKVNKSFSNGMDIITWQGLLMYRFGGPVAFIAFSGLSILPAQVTASDLVVRVVAALYLRQRSKIFRNWVHQIEHIHLFTWALRLGLAFFAVKGGAGTWFLVAMVGAIGTLLLRLAERDRGKAK